MSSWNSISTSDELQLVFDKSKTHPFVVFKHSTRCTLSSIAKMRLDDFAHKLFPVPFYLINVIESRAISDSLADILSVHHESPQLLLIHESECVYESSHLDINSEELASQIEQL